MNIGRGLRLVCLVLALAVLATAALTSCGRISADSLSGGFLKQDFEFVAPDADFYEAVTDVGLRVMARLAEKGENLTFSPLSMVLCLALIANGAEGSTLSEIEALIGMPIEDFNKMAYSFVNGLYSGKNCEVNIANSVWYYDGGYLKVRDEFLQTNADWYGADIFAAPFDESTVKDVNSWCDEKTDGMIDKVIDTIDDNTVMFLINALSFDAKWAELYEKSQKKDGVFNNYGGGTSNVQMLWSDEKYYIGGEGFRGFTKDYEGGKYSFVALLPDADRDVYEFAAGISGAEWLSILASKQRQSVAVCMPEFTNSSSLDLIDSMKALGVDDMFSDAGADFSSMATSDRGNLFVGIFKQESFIQVDMNGTKAAAITLGGMNDKATSVERYSVYLDRPFVYAIVDNATGVPMFVGVNADMGIK